MSLVSVAAEMTAGRKQFFEDIPGLQYAWDSTSLSALKTCPRKYWYSIVCGYRPKKEALPLTFGIYFHSALERYDRDRAKGIDHETALNHAVRVALECGGNNVTKRVCKRCDATHDMDTPDCVVCGLEDAMEERTEYVPWQTDCNNRNRENLVRSVVWYCEQFGDGDVLKTLMLKDGTPAVELSFRMESGYKAPNGTEYLMCGYMDRVVRFGEDGPIYVTDRKTTVTTPGDHYFQRYSPDCQMTLYTIASKVCFEQPAQGCIIDVAQVAVGFTRCQRGMVHRTQGQLEEWMHELGFWFKQAEYFAKEGIWPQNDKSCFNCNFQGICSKDPAVRQSFLETDYHRVDWNPLRERVE